MSPVIYPQQPDWQWKSDHIHKRQASTSDESIAATIVKSGGQLPPSIEEYLKGRHLKPYWVNPDGNCLYSSLTSAQHYTACTMARASVASYLEALQSPGNLLAHLGQGVKDIEQDIRPGGQDYKR
jgi:hypothetical protein